MVQSRFVVVAFMSVAMIAFGRNEVSSKLDFRHEPSPGVWCDDFTNTLAAAKAAHKPVLIVCAGTECSFCSRLNKSMNSADFKTWLSDRKIYMTEINDKHPQYKLTEAFERQGFKEVTAVPIVCVYWLKPDGTEVKKTFTGRRGMMPGVRNKFLQMEFISALDRVLADYTASLPSVKEIVHSPESKHFKFAMAGGSGKIVMEPPSGELADERGKVILTLAEGDSDGSFWGWTDPNGKTVGHARRLEIDSGMTEGVYTANFRQQAACKPPKFSVSAQPVTATIGKMFRYALDVDDATRPMTFSAEGMPFGLIFDSEEGKFSGVLWRKGCYTIRVTAVGGDLAKTKCIREFQLVVAARKAED